MKYMWKHTDGKLVEVEPGIKRRALARNEELLTIYYEFEKGAGTNTEFHDHPYTQMSYVQSGKFSFVVDGETYIVEAGDSMINPPSKPHACLCLEAGTIIDIFTPVRMDAIPEDEREIW